MSISLLRPSIHPSFRSPSRNAATEDCPSWSLSAEEVRTPIRRTRSGCCARAASGDAAAALPSSVMNSRRVLLDHLVGARDDCCWKLDTDRRGGFEVDGEVVLGRCLHRQVGRLLALEDAIDE